MKAILALSAFGLSVVGANACNMERSVQADVDQTVVASVVATESAMSKPVLPLPAPSTDQTPQQPEKVQ